jgi:hypothetical protein
MQRYFDHLLDRPWHHGFHFQASWKKWILGWLLYCVMPMGRSGWQPERFNVRILIDVINHAWRDFLCKNNLVFYHINSLHLLFLDKTIQYQYSLTFLFYFYRFIYGSNRVDSEYQFSNQYLRNVHIKLNDWKPFWWHFKRCKIGNGFLWNDNTTECILRWLGYFSSIIPYSCTYLTMELLSICLPLL